MSEELGNERGRDWCNGLGVQTGSSLMWIVSDKGRNIRGLRLVEIGGAAVKNTVGEEEGAARLVTDCRRVALRGPGTAGLSISLKHLDVGFRSFSLSSVRPSGGGHPWRRLGLLKGANLLTYLSRPPAQGLGQSPQSSAVYA